MDITPLLEHQLIVDAQQHVARAKREGSNYIFIPVWMLEALIEKATRPHD